VRQHRGIPVMIASTLYPPIRWSLSALWLSGSLLIFMTVGSGSLVSWMALVVAAVIPPVVFLSLWNDGPPPTIAEVLRATEDRKWRSRGDQR
jgi:hypothetical protein